MTFVTGDQSTASDSDILWTAGTFEDAMSFFKPDHTRDCSPGVFPSFRLPREIVILY